MALQRVHRTVYQWGTGPVTKGREVNRIILETASKVDFPLGPIPSESRYAPNGQGGEM
jgi:hypothetical protein